MIAYNTDHSGTRAEVWRMEKRNGEWFNIPLGTASGGDPMNTFINIALEYTEHDQELFTLIARQIERRTDDVLSDLRYLDNKLPVIIEDIHDCMAWLSYRCGAAAGV